MSGEADFYTKQVKMLVDLQAYIQQLEVELALAKKHCADANRGAELNAKVNQLQVAEINGLKDELARKDELLREIVEDAEKKYTCNSYLDMGWEDGYSPEARLRKIADKAREFL